MPPGKIKFFRTQSPRHFEGGDWYQGGSCQRQQPISPQQVARLYLFFLYYKKNLRLKFRVIYKKGTLELCP